MLLNIIDDLEKAMEPVKNWILGQHDNPMFWITVIMIGLAVFGIVYSALQKEK